MITIVGALRQATNSTSFLVSSARPAVAFASPRVVVRGYLHRLRVDDGDVRLVLDVDVDDALAVGHCLFGRAAEVDSSRALSRPSRRSSSRSSSLWLNTYTRPLNGVEQNSVWISVDVDRLDHGVSVFVSHIATGLLLLKPWPRLRIDGGAVPVGVGYFADRLERVEVVDRDPRARAAAWMYNVVRLHRRHTTRSVRRRRPSRDPGTGVSSRLRQSRPTPKIPIAARTTAIRGMVIPLISCVILPSFI